MGPHQKINMPFVHYVNDAVWNRENMLSSKEKYEQKKKACSESLIMNPPEV